MGEPAEPGGLGEAPGLREREGAEAAEPAASPVPENEASPGSEEQECRICYNLFDVGRRAPKLLECLHTFCQDCLSRLHGSGSPPSSPHGPAYVTCPLCRHCTALPDGCVQRLPVNTKLLAGISRQVRGGDGGAGEPPPGDFGPQRQRQRLLLQVCRPAGRPRRSPPSPLSRSRSPSQQSAGVSAASAAPTQSSSASVTVTSLEVCSESDGACGCFRKAGCLCVFALLASLLVFFAWIEWISGFVFLGVILIVLASVMPYAYKVKAAGEARAGPLTVTASGGLGEGAAGWRNERPGGGGGGRDATATTISSSSSSSGGSRC